MENFWSVLYPPKSILVLGLLSPATFRRIMSLGAADVVVIHPDEDAVLSLAESNSPSSSRLAIDTVAVSASPETSTFFKASLRRESGFIDPSRLQFLWRNICSEDTIEYEIVSLNDYLSNCEHTFSWIVTERLDVGQMLEDAKEHICKLDLVACRHLTTNRASELQDYVSPSEVMNANGFVAASVFDARHPDLVSTVFANDWKARLQTDVANLESSLRTKEEAVRHQASENQSITEKLEIREHELNLTREELNNRENEINSIQDKLAKSERDLEDLRDAMGKGALAQNNLSDLQDKYGALVEQNKKLEDFAQSVLEEASAARSILRESASASTAKGISK